MDTEPIRIPKTLSLLALVALAACGGSGGGGGSSTPPPAPPEFGLTDGNAPDAATLVLSGVEEMVLAALQVTGAAAALDASGETAVAIFCPEPSGPAPGVASYDDNDGSGSLTAGDSVSVLIPGCEGVTLSVQIDVTTIDVAALAGSVTFEIERDMPLARATGTFTLDQTETVDEATLAFTAASIDLTQDGSEESVFIASAKYEFDPSLGYTLSFSGNVDSERLDGTFSFRTATPLTGAFGFFPSAGSVLLTAGSSRASFSPPDRGGSGRIGEYRVNPDGTGFGDAVPSDWSSLMLGLMFGWVPNEPPVFTSMAFDPPNPTTSDAITITYTAEDPEGDSLSYQVDWRLNGTDLGTTSNRDTLQPTGLYVKGDVIEVTVRAYDSRTFTEATQSVTIANAAPVVEGTVTLSPAPANTTHDITASAEATDVDGDALTYSYVWRRNGELLPGQAASVLPSSEHQRDDEIMAVVSATDGEATVSTEVSLIIVDAPPAVTAVAAPANAPYGMPLSFDTNVADPDGDDVSALRFGLEHGPAGMSVDADTGLVSWQPGGPMFDRSMDVHWAVTTDAPATVAAAGTITVEDPDREVLLMRRGYEPALWPGGFEVGDFDGDGDRETMILSRRALYELTYDGEGAYRRSWMYPFAFTDREGGGQPDVSAFTTGDIDGDGRREIFVAPEGLVVRLDGLDRRVAATRDVGDNVQCIDLKYGDLDGDGAGEIVCLTESSPARPNSMLIVLRADDLSLRWQSPEAVYGESIAVGNVDADAPLEIVASGGHVIDGLSLATQWDYYRVDANGFGFDVNTADLDGDDVDEIVAAFDWQAPVRVYDARTMSLRWEETDDEDLGAMGLGDLDGDDIPEIVVGNGQSGWLTAYKVNSTGDGADILFQLPQQTDVRGIGIADLDGDDAPEIVWSMGRDAIVHVADAAGVLEWDIGVNPYGEFFGGQLAGSPSDARVPLFGSVDSESDLVLPGTLLLTMDPATGDLTLSPDLGRNANNAAAMVVTDYDDDGTDEAIFTAAQIYNNQLLAYDFFTSQIERATPLKTEQYSHALALAAGDLTDDGRDDIVSISPVGAVEAYDIFLDTSIWSTGLLEESRDVIVADLDRDNQPEIIALSRGVGLDPANLYVYERTSPGVFALTGSFSTPNGDWSFHKAAAADTDGDGSTELIVLAVERYLFGNSAQIWRLDADLNVLSSFILPWRATALAVEPSATARKNLIVPTGYGIGGPSSIVAVDAISGAEVWRSPLLRSAPWSNSLNFVMLPGETELRMTISTDHAIYLTR